MINIINSQLYKIFRSRTTYIILAIACAIPLLEVLLLGNINMTVNGTTIDLGYDCVSNLRSMSIIGSDTNVLVIIAIAILFGQEYSQRTITNSVMAGNSRTNIYVASFVSASVLMLVVALPAFAVYGVSSIVAFGYSSTISSAQQIIANIGASLIVYLLSNIICVAITMLFVHVTQKVSASILFPLLLILLVSGIGSSVLVVMVMLGELSLSTLSWIPLAQFYVYSGMLSYGTYVLSWALVGKIALISVLLTALLSLLGWLKLQKSNIK